MQYSVEFKKAAVEKYLKRGSRQVQEILDEIGIASPTIYQWRDQFANIPGMKKETRPQKKSVSEKLKAVVDYDGLAVDKRGEFLRRNGLHEENIAEWRHQIESALTPGKRTSQERIDLVAEQKKVKQLEKDLRRKEKALAEASALLILKKKAELIWGVEEEE